MNKPDSYARTRVSILALIIALAFTSAFARAAAASRCCEAASCRLERARQRYAARYDHRPPRVPFALPRPHRPRIAAHASRPPFRLVRAPANRVLVTFLSIVLVISLVVPLFRTRRTRGIADTSSNRAARDHDKTLALVNKILAAVQKSDRERVRLRISGDPQSARSRVPPS
jgi:hypothetical protein